LSTIKIPLKMANVVEVISSIDENGELQWFTLQEFIEMPTAMRVMLTIGERKLTYYSPDNEEVRIGEAIIFIGKQRRNWMDSTGQKY
jgi:hypothetical protein